MRRTTTTDSAPRPRIAIIGAGLSGLGAAVRFKKAGFHDVTIFDRWPAAGGTWWANTYPGVEVDTDSHVYRHSFHLYPWPQTHPTGRQVLGYVESLVQKYSLSEHLRLSTTVSRVEWQEDSQSYAIDTDTGRFEAEILVSAVGLLSEPSYPEWADRTIFTGPIIHTAEWDHSVSLQGKKVAVIGTGSSAASVIPAIADEVDELIVYQRDPAWVLPKNCREYTGEERIKLVNPWYARAARFKALRDIYKFIADGRITQTGTAENLAAQQAALQHLESVLGDYPELKQLMTPKYPFLGKRALVHGEYLKTFTKSNVHLIPQAVTGLTPTGIVSADGEECEVDVVILATGFRASDFISSVNVTGRGGLDLHAYWNSEPKAFLGIVVPNFPNFFSLYGPNTNGSGSVMLMMEIQAKFAVWAAKRLRSGKATSVEVREGIFNLYSDWIDRECAKTVFHTTNNYYKSPSGRVVTNWPRGIPLYQIMNWLLRRPAMKSTLHPVSGRFPLVPADGVAAQVHPERNNEGSYENV